jgi:hypothetical protein
VILGHLVVSGCGCGDSSRRKGAIPGPPSASGQPPTVVPSVFHSSAYCTGPPPPRAVCEQGGLCGPRHTRGAPARHQRGFWACRPARLLLLAAAASVQDSHLPGDATRGTMLVRDPPGTATC